MRKPWRISLGIAGLLAAFAGRARATVDFDRDVRPILSNNCYACHGPDEAERKAKLRLDNKEGVFSKVKDRTMVTPGDLAHSEVFKRVTSTDPQERMPPAKSGKELKPEQIAVLKAWIEEGAEYKTHWAFSPPQRAPLPEVKHAEWVRNPIDRFVLARLEKEGLSPSSEADRYALIRRVSLDLTGLPPTPAEVDAFVYDNRPDAYERLVDRLLASPHYGERMARPWLDLARYADSAGYGSDPLRKTIHPYRDWVIDAFNANKTYDQFTIEQLAGDLLPNPTLRQLIATAFHRNTMTNTEGGTDDEEWRTAAVKDRSEVTFQVWMGLTMGCAQCHSHKYDPITNKEYYQAFAFFNQSEDSDKDDERPTIETPTPEQAAKKAELTAKIEAIEKKVSDSAFLSPLQAAWEAKALADADEGWTLLKPATAASSAGATLAPQPDGSLLVTGQRGKTDVYTVSLQTDLKGINAFKIEALPDPSLPSRGPGRGDNGAFALSDVKLSAKTGESGPLNARYIRIEVPDNNTWLHLAEVQVFAGKENVAPKGKASQSTSSFDGDAQRAIDGNTDGDFDAKSVNHTDRQDNPWWEVDLGSVQKIDRLAIWNRTDHGLGERLRKFRVIALDGQRKPIWQSQINETPKPSVTLDPTRGESIALQDASATTADAGKAIDGDASEKSGWIVNSQSGRAQALVVQTAAPVGSGEATTISFTITQNQPDAPVGRFRISATTRARPIRALPSGVRETLAVKPAERTESEKAELAAYFKTVSPDVQAAQSEVAELKKQMQSLQIARTAIMRELPPDQRRASAMLVKGNFMNRGEAVEPIVPAAFNRFPNDAPHNRLGLANWLVDRQNPLTARVEVNRLWAMLFGLGIVETQEDFGSQGTPPVNPQLLDWLAVEFMEPTAGAEPRQAWDIKRMMKLIVMSATYRQSSKATPELLQRDPRNRLLARAPRLRLDAEQVRDQALSLAGLLSLKVHGPSVYPPQPDGLWQAAFNGERTYPTSTGEDRYRRGLYTFWRRTVPYPSMAAFDAPSRETCTLRRIHTSTPLQAFVTLNDPVYVEAAQKLAGRLMKEGGATTEERIRFGLRLCLERPPTNDRVAALVSLHQDELKRYQSDAEAAKKLAAPAEGEAPKEADAPELAAWTVVANVLLNLDGVMTRG